eukprot:g11505.t1
MSSSSTQRHKIPAASLRCRKTTRSTSLETMALSKRGRAPGGGAAGRTPTPADRRDRSDGVAPPSSLIRCIANPNAPPARQHREHR